jgi:hypothetical protein
MYIHTLLIEPISYSNKYIKYSDALRSSLMYMQYIMSKKDEYILRCYTVHQKKQFPAVA